MDTRRIRRHRRLGRKHHRQLFVVHPHRFGSEQGSVPGLRHNHGHRLALVSGLAVREHMMGIRHVQVDIRVHQGSRLENLRHRAIELGIVPVHDDLKNTRHQQGLVLVDAEDPRVRVRRPDGAQIEHVFKLDVVHEPPGPGQQATILFAPERLAEDFRFARFHACSVIVNTPPRRHGALEPLHGRPGKRLPRASQAH